MPGFDGTGPRGFGAGSGWGRGPCGAGYGWGRRWRHGFRGYFGRCFGYQPYAPEPVELTKEEQRKILEAELKEIEAEKQEIEKRLKETQ